MTRRDRIEAWVLVHGESALRIGGGIALLGALALLVSLLTS